MSKVYHASGKFIQISGGYALDEDGSVWQYRTGMERDDDQYGTWRHHSELEGWVQLSDVRFPLSVGDTK